MKYQLIVPKRVQKELDKIDSRYKARISIALLALEGDPFLGKKLKGEYQKERSYEVWPFRIVYEIRKRELIVLIITIAHRQGVY
jgi:mRNA interferase RelE/StbE